ncbi:hypothetical protein O6P43_005937 [Quillaja saponaria]|uniref:Uncharacterized protein n=1 Tax=Quillaja saponaria TaxID=32244 RepID=A0AAD7VHP8_QUISA|nr:hypothetical protein O6P43_005937 [Quillaja saponaria]
MPHLHHLKRVLPYLYHHLRQVLPYLGLQLKWDLPYLDHLNQPVDIPPSPGDCDVGHIMESSAHNSQLGTSGNLSTSRVPVIEPPVTRGYAYLDPPPTNPADRLLIRIRTERY